MSQEEIAGCAEDLGLGESGNIGDHHRGEQNRKLGQEGEPQISLLPLGLTAVRLGFQTVWS